MTDTDESAYRRHYRATGDEVTVRQGDELDNDDDVFELRMPIASTGEVRNEGDDPLTRNELNGMARQLNDREIGVFPAHGSDSMIAAGRYSPFERLGDWTDASIESREDENVLMATARMPDPESLPAATKQYRTALAILKEQAVRGVSQDASIGWRDDDEFPGGVDLMEASIVGIGADWRTNMGDESAEVVARAALDAGADKSDLVERVKRAVGDDEWSAKLRYFRVVAPEDREDEFDDTVLGVGVSFPESGVYVDWHTSAFPDELENPHVSEYGSVSDLQKATGNDIVDMERPPGSRAVRAAIAERKGRPLGPEDDPNRFDDWDDCMSAMQESGHSEAEAKRICGSFKDESEAQSADRNLDDPAYSEGDAVAWDWQGETVYGRVADVGDEFTVGGNTITGDEGEAVYLIHEWDETVEAFREENVAKPESSLSASDRDLPPANDDNMTDQEPDDEPTDEQDATDAETEQVRQSPAEIADMAEDYVMGAVEGAIDDLRNELEDMMGDGGENESDDDYDEDEDDEDEQSADDPDSEQSDTPADEQDADADELRSELESLREELDDLRDGGVAADDVESPDPDNEQDAEDTDESEAEPSRDTAEDPTGGLGDYR